MKIEIDIGELYPYYSYDEQPDTSAEIEVEVEPETIKRWDKVFQDFFELQAEIKGLIPSGSNWAE